METSELLSITNLINQAFCLRKIAIERLGDGETVSEIVHDFCESSLVSYLMAQKIVYSAIKSIDSTR